MVVAMGLLLVAGAASAQERVYDGLDVDLDPETLSGYAAAVRAHAPLGLAGEAFEELRSGWGGSAAFTFFFGARYAARARVAITSFDENILDPLDVRDDHARLTEVWGELLWRRAWGRFGFEAGPGVGYARLSRPGLATAQGGFMAGAVVGTSARLGRRWSVVLDGTLAWSTFDEPDWAVPSPPGFPDDGAEGRRTALGLGLAYRWGGPR